MTHGPLAFRRICVIAFTVLFLAGCSQAPKAAGAGEIEVYFSPRGGCQEAVVREIDAAEKSIRCQAYSFTNAKITEALLKAKKRGVDVEVILDKSQVTAKYSSATFFENNGVPLLIDAKHALAHNKIMILDGKTVITGSFNFTKAAENENAENLLIIKGFPEIEKKYEANCAAHREHAAAYERSAKRK